MKIARIITYTVSVACLLCSCTKEVPVTAPRDIAAEFPSDQDVPETADLLLLDGIDSPLTGTQIDSAVAAYSPDIIFFVTDGTIDGEPLEAYLEKNRSIWGHDKSFTAGGNGCSTSLSAARADSLEIYVSAADYETFLTLNVAGYNFVCGNITSKNCIYKNGKGTLMEYTVMKDGLAHWVVLCHAWWEGSTPWDISQYYWPGYGYNEVVFSKFGKDCLPERREFTFVSEGLLNCIHDTQASPICFDFDIEEE